MSGFASRSLGEYDCRMLLAIITALIILFAALLLLNWVLCEFYPKER